jgi:hypothetical protein
MYIYTHPPHITHINQTIWYIGDSHGESVILPSHARMIHVTDKIGACHTYEWVISRIWMRHATGVNAACPPHLANASHSLEKNWEAKINTCCHFAISWQVASCSLKNNEAICCDNMCVKRRNYKGIRNLQEHGWQSSIHMFWSCRQLRLTPAVWQSDLDASTLDALFVPQVPALDSSYLLFCSPQWWCAMTL